MAQFLSEAWLDEVASIRAELGDEVSSGLGDAQLNLVVTDGPEGEQSLHLADGNIGTGLLDEAPATLTVDHEVARRVWLWTRPRAA